MSHVSSKSDQSSLTEQRVCEREKERESTFTVRTERLPHIFSLLLAVSKYVLWFRRLCDLYLCLACPFCELLKSTWKLAFSSASLRKQNGTLVLPFCPSVAISSVVTYFFHVTSGQIVYINILLNPYHRTWWLRRDPSSDMQRERWVHVSCLAAADQLCAELHWCLLCVGALMHLKCFCWPRGLRKTSSKDQVNACLLLLQPVERLSVSTAVLM